MSVKPIEYLEIFQYLNTYYLLQFSYSLKDLPIPWEFTKDTLDIDISIFYDGCGKNILDWFSFKFLWSLLITINSLVGRDILRRAQNSSGKMERMMTSKVSTPQILLDNIPIKNLLKESLSPW